MLARMTSARRKLGLDDNAPVATSVPHHHRRTEILARDYFTVNSTHAADVLPLVARRRTCFDRNVLHKYIYDIRIQFHPQKDDNRRMEINIQQYCALHTSSSSTPMMRTPPQNQSRRCRTINTLRSDKTSYRVSSK